MQKYEIRILIREMTFKETLNYDSSRTLNFEQSLRQALEKSNSIIYDCWKAKYGLKAETCLLVY